jgi:hypothetical protein
MPASRVVVIDELAIRERTDGLEKSEACRAALVLRGVDERAVHESGEQLRHAFRIDRAARAHVEGGVEVESAGEHGQPLQDGLRVGVEQAVGPADRRVECLLAGESVAGRADESTEASVEIGGELCRTEQSHLRGCELDGEGDAVDAPADRDDGVASRVVDHEAGTDRRRPLLEQHGGVTEFAV